MIENHMIKRERERERARDVPPVHRTALNNLLRQLEIERIGRYLRDGMNDRKSHGKEKARDVDT